MKRCPLLRTATVAAALALSGCGRLGFDAVPSDASDEMAGAIAAIEIVPPRFETSSPTFVDVPGGLLTIPPSPGQTWLLAVSATLESSSGIYDAPEARYLVDGIERGMGGTEAVVPGRPGPWQHFFVLTGTNLPIEIVVQARDALAATTALDELRVAAIPLPAAADPLYASSDAIFPVTAQVLTTAAQLVVTPQAPGEYVFLLLVNATEGPSTSDIDFQWFDPAGVSWLSNVKITRGAWQSFLVTRRAVLTGTATIELRASTGGAMAQVQYARVLGLRVDGLGAALAHAHVDQQIVAASATPALANELRPAVAAAPHYLVLGTARLEDDCANVQLADRGAHYAVDGFVQATGHVAGNCAYETTYGFVDVVDSAPSVVSLSVSSGNAQNVEHEESSLIVLGVP